MNTVARATINQQLFGRIVALAGQRKTDLESIIVGAVAVLLSRFAGRREVALGVLDSKSGSAYLVRGQISQRHTFVEAVQNLEQIRDKGLNQTVSRDGSIVFWPLREEEESGTSKLVASFVFTKTVGAITYFVNADGNVDLAQCLAWHLVNLMESVVLMPDALLSSHRKSHYTDECVLRKLAGADTLFPDPLPIAELFADVARKVPDCTAIVADAQEISYRRLRVLCESRADELASLGVSAGSMVGIAVDRSIVTIAAMLASWMCGATCVLLDPLIPSHQLRALFADCNLDVVLVPEMHRELLLVEGAILNAKLDTPLCSGRTANRSEGQYKALAGHAAAVIFTSGSTGHRKAVVLTHTNLIRAVKYTNYIEIVQSDRILQAANPAFDGSLFNILGALLNGATLVLTEKVELLSSGNLRRVIRENDVSVMFIPTIIFNRLVEQEPACFSSLRFLMIGGDRASSWHVARALENMPSGEIVNGYGPTECGILATYHSTREKSDVSPEFVPIGVPVQYTGVAVVDSDIADVPVLAQGELLIGGEAVALGYLNDPEKTHDAFIRLPGSHRRVYRTGDQVRLHPDGKLEFRGRVDRQVKVRGFRIEIDELEKEISRHSNINNVVILPDPEGKYGTTLHLFYASLIKYPPEALRSDLRRALPPQCVPQTITLLDAIPSGPNGKVDREQLATLVRARQGTSEPDSGTHEGVLAGLFANSLPIKTGNVDKDADYFELGGHSLSASCLAYSIARKFDVDCSFADILANPTVRMLEGMVHQRSAEQAPAWIGRTGVQSFGLSLSQRRLYFLDQLIRPGLALNLQLMLKCPVNVDYQRLTSTLNAVLSRHDVLRSSFTCVEGEIVQKIESDALLRLETAEGAPGTFPEILKDFIQPIEMEKAPLMRAKLASVAGAAPILILDIHHLVCDGQSLSIIRDEIEALYNGNALPPLCAAFKDYARWHRRRIAEAASRGDVEYWSHQFQCAPAVRLNSGTRTPNELETVQLCLGPKLSNAIKLVLKRHKTSLLVLASAVYARSLASTFGWEDVLFCTIINNRSRPEFNRTVGPFTAPLPILVRELSARSDIQLLGLVRDTVVEAFRRQDVEFETEIRGRRPLFDCGLTIQAFLDATIEGDSKSGVIFQLLHSEPIERHYAVPLNVEITERATGFELQATHSTGAVSPPQAVNILLYMKKSFAGFAKS